MTMALGRISQSITMDKVTLPEHWPPEQGWIWGLQLASIAPTNY